VAVLPSVAWVPLDAEIGAAIESLAAALGRLGCQVKSVQPPELGDFRQHYALYLSLLASVQFSRVPPETRRGRLDVMRTRDDDWSRAFQRGAESTAPDYIGWVGQREQVRAAWRAFFTDWDVLIAPAFFTPAYPHWDKPWPDTEASIRKTLDVNGKAVLEELGLFYPSVATVAGQPATALPVGLTRGGLPIGVQAIGPYLEDRTPLRFAALLAQEFGGFKPPPGYAAD
jgi:amidase